MSFLNFHFANPWWFAALPLAILLLFLAGKKGLVHSVTFSSLSIIGALGKKVKKRPLGVHSSLLFGAVIFSIIALARPQELKTHTTTNSNGIDIVVALDLSLSMIIDDFYPNDDLSKRPIRRLDAAKEVLYKFIRLRENDRIGVIAFSGRPYSLSPITLDHSWVASRLKAIELGDIEEAGTAIGSAISASATRLNDRKSESKVIILITDGASNTGKIDPVEAAKLASKLGIKIYTIAIGTEKGRVPKRIQSFPKQEFDIPTLTEIASTTSGEFFRARSVSDLESTFLTIDELEKTEVETTDHTTFKEHYYLFAGAALVLSLLSLLYRVFVPLSAPQ